MNQPSANRAKPESHFSNTEASAFMRLFPPALEIHPISRWPTELPPETLRVALESPLPNVVGYTGQADGEERCPRADIIIITRDNLAFTKMCIASVLLNTDYQNYGVVVVDNGSQDSTIRYLKALESQHPHIKCIFNNYNRGFAAANNQGIDNSEGDMIILLNNDTLVPAGWLTRLVRYLADSEIGMAGPVTNRTCNEAQIEVPYQTYEEFARFSENRAEQCPGKATDIRMLAMFCVAMRRNVYDRVGPLDERFEIGMFEDDDYAVRVRKEGYRIICTPDVFVHHFGQVSIGQLVTTGQYSELFEANRSRFEDKWEITWEPHRRDTSDYLDLSEQIRRVTENVFPLNSIVLAVSKGDDLLKAESIQTWHYPQDEDGRYSGYYPADSEEAITHLEELRRKGGEFLLFPRTSFWWLDYYQPFREYLMDRYELAYQGDSCLVFSLER